MSLPQKRKRASSDDDEEDSKSILNSECASCCPRRNSLESPAATTAHPKPPSLHDKKTFREASHSSQQRDSVEAVSPVDTWLETTVSYSAPLDHTSTRLTAENLAELNAVTPSARRTMPPRAPNTPSSSKSSQRSLAPSITSQAALRRLYRLHNFYDVSEDSLDNETAPDIPDDIAQLILSIQADRSEISSPNARQISQLSRITTSMKEMDAMIELEGLIGYIPSYRPNGAQHIRLIHNQLWRKDCLPQPVNKISTQNMFEKMGIMATPKPDIFYGYDVAAFLPKERRAVDLHREQVCPHNEEQALFPFLVVEWKSDLPGGTSMQGKDQAIRDGAAAVHSMHCLYDACGAIATPAQTAVFSAVVTSRMIDLRIHWRQQEGDEVFWNTKRFESGFLEREDDMLMIRRSMKNILDWTQGPRLDEIRRQLAGLGLGNTPGPIDSGSSNTTSNTPQLPSPATSQSVRPRTSKRRRVDIDDQSTDPS